MVDQETDRTRMEMGRSKESLRGKMLHLVTVVLELQVTHPMKVQEV